MKPIIINLNFIGETNQSPQAIAEALASVQSTLNQGGVIAQNPLPATNSWLSRLNEEQMHFLSVFVHCEGKIKDVEKALGVSYPTVKSKLSELKSQLAQKPSTPSADETSDLETNQSVMEILNSLEQGVISNQEAIHQINSMRQKG